MRKPIYAPFGRMQEQVQKLSDDERQRAAIMSGVRLGDDDKLQIFPNRTHMAKLIRREERRAPRSRWRPVVPLTDGEGY